MNKKTYIIILVVAAIVLVSWFWFKQPKTEISSDIGSNDINQELQQLDVNNLDSDFNQIDQDLNNL